MTGDGGGAGVVHRTVSEREAAGRAVRSAVPRGSLGEWAPASDRGDPVAILERQARGRVPELVPIRYARMLASPFAFLRGAAAVMAADLAPLPRTGLTVQLCGDAHLSNFGGFAAPDRRLVFSVNDFDETLPGPFEWDLRRLAASIEVAGRERGFSRKERRAHVAAAASAYRREMGRFAAARTLDVWYARLEVEALVQAWRRELPAKRLVEIEEGLEPGRPKDSLVALAKLTTVVDGEPRIVARPPLLVPARDLSHGEHDLDVLRNALESYRRTLSSDRRTLFDRFRMVDVARKVVGVGSVGTRSWIILLLGRDAGDPLFLQAKEADASVLEEHLGRSAYDNQGRRVVEGQRLTQPATDVLLGWDRVTGLDGSQHDFYLRQLWDEKTSAMVDTLSARTMTLYADLCGATLARGHARSGDPVAIAAYAGSGRALDDALAAFAVAYADVTERDHAALEEAARSGRIPVAERA